MIRDLKPDDFHLRPGARSADGMGLSRSEALGVRWSWIDMENKKMLLDTKIVEDVKKTASLFCAPWKK